mgnify:CR=1 FL=1
MKLSSKTKASLLLIGDIIALYTALILTLFIRYGGNFYEEFIGGHLAPFSFVFVLWIIVFYIAGLYDLPRLRNNIDFLKTLALALAVNALLTIALFYLIPVFGIAPRRNLFIFLIVFTVIEAWWRQNFNIRASFREGLNKILLLGEGPRINEIAETLGKNPQIGYEIRLWLKKGLADPESGHLHELVKTHHINLIVIPSELKKNLKLTKAFYELLASGVEIVDFPSFYELVFRKLPLADLEEAWFLENKIGQKKFYDDLKRGLEFVAGCVIGIVLLPLELLIAILIKITSPGAVIYKQARIGIWNESFVLYKFRTMREDAEKDGPQWADTKDNRTTFIGGFLRYTHLDELPQLVNVIKGELSFVGPRPERPEFVALLEKEIPHYKIRHLIQPGITGWAQINYRYGASVDDTQEKLQYDIYYLKNRSLILDCAIILKTFKSFFINQK